MIRKRRPQGDPIEQEIELALNPGAFIPDHSCSSFVSDLYEAANKVAELVESDPARVVALYETFLAACHLKIQELDDSSGSFGDFVVELYCGWIEARQADGADPEETASRLLTWMDQDNYGFCHRLETHAVKVFDKANLAAFVRLVRARVDAAAQKTANKDDRPRERPDYIRRRWGEALRTLYAAQRDIAAYVALAEETGLTAKDCHAIARLLVSKRKPEEALSWVERGLELDKQSSYGSMASHDLAELQRNLLIKLGRGDQALDAAWSDYREDPSTCSYNDLMKYVPKGQRKRWHEKAMEATVGADLQSIMDLLVETKELDRLAELVRQTKDADLEGLSHYTTEPAAKKLEKPHPGLAARLWRAQGLRIVNPGKSKYYDAALSDFERAKRCFERAGLTEEWSKTVRQIRTDHSRKSSVMRGLERLERGPANDEPSFLDRAKAQWRAK